LSPTPTPRGPPLIITDSHFRSPTHFYRATCRFFLLAPRSGPFPLTFRSFLHPPCVSRLGRPRRSRTFLLKEVLGSCSFVVFPRIHPFSALSVAAACSLDRVPPCAFFFTRSNSGSVLHPRIARFFPVPLFSFSLFRFGFCIPDDFSDFLALFGSLFFPLCLCLLRTVCRLLSAGHRSFFPCARPEALFHFARHSLAPDVSPFPPLPSFS